MQEYFPIVNEAGEVLDKATRQACHDGSHLLHPVVHLHVFSPEGALYLQRRAMHKDLLPGYWDTAVGGHVSYGETIAEALPKMNDKQLSYILGYAEAVAELAPDRTEQKEKKEEKAE